VQGQFFDRRVKLKKKKNKKKIKRIRSKLEETKYHKPRLNYGIENHQKP
jgi:hypothetical protein